MKCCTLPDGERAKKGSRKVTRHRKKVTKLAVAAKQCAGKHKAAFRKCVKAKIRKMRG